MRLLIAFALVCIPSSAAAQEVRELGTTTRGRVPDATTMLAARDIVRRAGVDCQVEQTIALGRDATGTPQYEVSCRTGPGYLLVGAPINRAMNCLALAAGSVNERSRRGRTTGCRMRSNQNVVKVVAALARRAAFECRIDQGAFLGQSPAGLEIYEAGCAGEVGALIEQTEEGWAVTSCTKALAFGITCQFTTSAEQLSDVRRWMIGSTYSHCAPQDFRFMGNDRTISFYEIKCSGTEDVIGSIGPANALLATTPCDEARQIGDGCRLRDRAADPLSD